MSAHSSWSFGGGNTIHCSKTLLIIFLIKKLGKKEIWQPKKVDIVVWRNNLMPVAIKKKAYNLTSWNQQIISHQFFSDKAVWVRRDLGIDNTCWLKVSARYWYPGWPLYSGNWSFWESKKYTKGSFMYYP